MSNFLTSNERLSEYIFCKSQNITGDWEKKYTKSFINKTVFISYTTHFHEV